MMLLRPFLVCIGILLSHAVFAQKLVEGTFLERKSKEQITADLGGLLPVPYDADYYKVLYTTRDLQGRTDTASGALIIPDAPGLALPLLIDQHGTAPSKNEIPSAGAYLTAEIGLILSNIVIAPDLLGLGESRGFHPYLHAESEAWAAIDMLFAARELLDQLGVPYNGQLFITGYSQGGHGSAALQRELEENYGDQVQVSGAAHVSGPMDISGEMLNVLLGEEPYSLPAFFPYALLSYFLAYDLYEDPVAVLKEPYAGFARQFSTWEIDFFELNTLISNQLLQDHGQTIPRYMVQDSILVILEEKNPDHPLVAALLDNDLLDWVPEAPTRFIHCSGDELVPFRNSVLADSIMNANGAPDVALIDASPSLGHLACITTGAAVFPQLSFFGPLQDIVSNTFDPSLPEVSVFPNPASTELRVDHVPAGTLGELYNLEGRPVRRFLFRDQPERIPVADLPSGLYILRMRHADLSLSRKVWIRP